MTRQLRVDDATVCQDPSCDVEIEQPLTGRPKAYCDVTCRKNAARHRDWDRYVIARREWQERDNARRRIHENLQRAWDAKPAPVLAEWQATALSSGWQPPGGRTVFLDECKRAMYGQRPADYRSPSSDQAPAQPSMPRTGKKDPERNYW